MKQALLFLVSLLLLSGNVLAQRRPLLYDPWTRTVATNDRTKWPSGGAADFVAVGSSWNNRILTYSFTNGTPDVASDGGRQAVRDAMKLWSDQTDLVFLEVCPGAPADIIILWGAGAHGDGFPFDGLNGVLAHAFFPPPIGGSFAGDMHFDEDETWTTSTRDNGGQPIDLVTVAAHELGHVLGLDHTDVSGSLMQAIYSKSQRFLGPDDIAGIRSIYGASGSNNGNNLVSGPITLCVNNTAAYSIPNPPTGITFTWASSNPTVATINPSTGVATGVTNGTVTFTATANTSCGSITLSKSVTIGAPLTPRLNASSSLSPACWSASNVINFSVATPQPGVLYTTDFVEAASGQIVESITGPSFSFRVGLLSNGTSYNVVTSARNACDNSGNSRSSRTMRTQSCGSGPRSIAMYPNPATNSVEFRLQEATAPAETNAATASPSFQVSIYDSRGQLRWTGSTSTNTTALRFDSSRLPRGMYGAVITEDNGVVTRLNLSLE